MTVSQYLGSQAYNASFNTDEYVIKNTGSFTVSVPLVQLRGITEAIGLNLTLNFTSCKKGQLGLPDGWGLGLPFVANGKSMVVDGKTFVIDPHWSDSSGHKSGLRYLNDHGSRFEQIIPPQLLPEGGGRYGFKMSYGNGSVGYFDATGKLVLQTDLFGNKIRYSYVKSTADIFNNRLSTITDSFGQVVKFGYGPNNIVITLPDDSSIIIEYSETGVKKITNQIGAVTFLSYEDYLSHTVISSIDYPTGLKTNLTYTGLSYLDANGKKVERPAVRNLSHLDLKGRFLDNVRYAYGMNSGGNNFSGANAGYRQSPDSDKLMDSGNVHYYYDIAEQKTDQNNHILTAVTTMFNYLHIPVTEIHYLFDDNGHGTKSRRNKYSYDIPIDMHARSINMSKPTKTVHSSYDHKNKKWIDTAQARAKYNEFGNVIVSQQYDLSTGTPVLISERNHRYSETSWGGNIPQQTDFIDSVTGKRKRLLYTLTNDQKCIASTEVQTKAKDDIDFVPYKTKAFTYDEHGRNIGWSLCWTAGSPQSKEDDLIISETISYSYNPDTHELSTVSKDANGYNRVSVYDMRLPAGPCLNLQNPRMSTIHFEYDSFGRCVKKINALNHTSTSVYKIASMDGVNLVETTQQNNYQLRITYDARGKAVLFEDNGDPTAKTPVLNRVIRKGTFNCLGLKTSETNITGHTISYEYDSLNRTTAVLDPLGNKATTVYDDCALTVQNFMNGELKQVTKVNGLGKTIREELHSDSASDQAGQIRCLISTHDGFGQVLTEAHSSITPQGSHVNATKDFKYNPDGNVTKIIFQGMPEDTKLWVQKTKEIRYSIHGSPTKTTHAVDYAGQDPLKTEGETLYYDAVGNLTKIVNQHGQEEILKYNENSLLESRSKYGGETLYFDYNAADQLTTTKMGTIEKRTSYHNNNLIKTISTPDGTIAYNYSLDGTAKGITYADGRSASFIKDAYSRITKTILPDGSTVTYTYNQLGQVETSTLGSVTLTHEWGSVNHCHGVLVAKSLKNGEEVQNTQFSYDGFGCINHTHVTNGLSDTMFSAHATRDGSNNLVSLQLSSEVVSDASVNQTREMRYDGLKQLIEVTSTPVNEQKSTESYRYDGAFNVISKNIDGHEENYSYNTLNQLTSGLATYDTNGRMTSDINGYTYDFDARDRLIKAGVDKDKVLHHLYGPQGALSSITDGEEEEKFYPIGGSMATTQTNSKKKDNEWHKILWSDNVPAACVSDTQITTYSGAEGSINLHSTSKNNSSVSISAYGEVKSDSPLTRSNSFNWNSQYSDPASGLTYMRARWYSPHSKRFLSLDPKLTSNRYAYCAGNPIGNVDPLGESAASIIAGFFVGLASVALVEVGGEFLLAAYGATTTTFASTAAASVSGAVGSLTGGLTSAGASGEKVTGRMVLTDLLAGAVGGAAGAGLGGSLGQYSMKLAMEANYTRNAIVNIGSITSSTTGGLAGAVASGGVSSLMMQQPFFSNANAVNMSLGFLAGGLGGLLESGAALGKRNLTVLPVTIKEGEFHLIKPIDDLSENQNGKKLLNYHKDDPNDMTELLSNTIQAMSFDNGQTSGPVDTIVVHGNRNIIAVGVQPRSADAMNYVRPISGRRFAKYLTEHAFTEHVDDPLKLVSCYGSCNNAQLIADALNRDVWTAEGKMTGLETNLSVFHPKSRG